MYECECPAGLAQPDCATGACCVTLVGRVHVATCEKLKNFTLMRCVATLTVFTTQMKVQGHLSSASLFAQRRTSARRTRVYTPSTAPTCSTRTPATASPAGRGPTATSVNSLRCMSSHHCQASCHPPEIRSPPLSPNWWSTKYKDNTFFVCPNL